MDLSSKERTQLALKVLGACCHVGEEMLTPSEIATLRSYLDGDLAGMALDDIAVAVIHQERERKKTAPQPAKIA